MGYASEPTFSPPPEPFHWTVWHTIVAMVVALAGLGYLLGTHHLSQAHDLPRAVNMPARSYTITIFQANMRGCTHEAQGYEITNNPAEGQLLRFSSDGVHYVYSGGPFLIKGNR